VTTRRTFAQMMSPPPEWPVRRHHWPRYLVSARHAVVPTGSADRVPLPYDVWHAREVGSPQAVCGAPAVEWKMFWTLDFKDAGLRACPDCAKVASRRP
jgi:hypothetical protein